MPGVLIIEAEKGTLGGVAGDTNYLPRRGKHASFPPVCSIDAYFSGAFASARERYGAWLLEYPRSSVVTLSFKRSVALEMKLPHQNLDLFANKAITQLLSQYLSPSMERLKIGETWFLF